MGNSPAVGGRAPIHTFYSTRSWIEGNATKQLEDVASLPGIKAVAGMPDLHPGKYGPVGCSILADRIYPAARRLRHRLRHGPVPARPCRAQASRRQGGRSPARARCAMGGRHRGALAEAGLAPTPFDASLGTSAAATTSASCRRSRTSSSRRLPPRPGSIARRPAARAFRLARARLLDPAAAAGGGCGTARPRERGRARLSGRARHRRALGGAEPARDRNARDGSRAARRAAAIANLSHNLVEATGAGILHRKGTAPADRGLVPIPGSRGTLSYLVEPLAAPGRRRWRPSPTAPAASSIAPPCTAASAPASPIVPGSPAILSAA